MTPETILIILALVISFYMAWNIGANDVANAMGTSVGSGALTLKWAILVAALMEFAGAFLVGSHVTNTVRKGIIDPVVFIGDPNSYIYGMMAALLAAGTWLLIASSKGWPVSTTHSIVGSIVGFVIISMGFQAVSWDKVGTIAASWVVSPAISGTMAFFIFLSAKKFILDRKDPAQAAVSLIPLYSFFVAVIIGLVTARKGLKHVGLPLTDNEVVLVTIAFGLVVTVITYILLNINKEKIKKKIGIDDIITEFNEIRLRGLNINEANSLLENKNTTNIILLGKFKKRPIKEPPVITIDQHISYRKVKLSRKNVNSKFNFDLYWNESKNPSAYTVTKCDPDNLLKVGQVITSINGFPLKEEKDEDEEKRILNFLGNVVYVKVKN